jgi:hypothetical protein
MWVGLRLGSCRNPPVRMRRRLPRRARARRRPRLPFRRGRSHAWSRCIIRRVLALAVHAAARAATRGPHRARRARARRARLQGTARTGTCSAPRSLIICNAATASPRVPLHRAQAPRHSAVMPRRAAVRLLRHRRRPRYKSRPLPSRPPRLVCHPRARRCVRPLRLSTSQDRRAWAGRVRRFLSRAQPLAQHD